MQVRLVQERYAKEECREAKYRLLTRVFEVEAVNNKTRHESASGLIGCEKRRSKRVEMREWNKDKARQKTRQAVGRWLMRELRTRLDRSSARSRTSKIAEAGERSVKEGIEAEARRRTKKDKCRAGSKQTRRQSLAGPRGRRPATDQGGGQAKMEWYPQKSSRGEETVVIIGGDDGDLVGTCAANRGQRGPK